MQCPECGYQLTPFDKDCPRCTNFAAKGLKPAKQEAIHTNLDAKYDDTQPVNPDVVATTTPSHQEVRRKQPYIIIFVALALATLVLGYGSFSAREPQNNIKSGTDVSQQSNTKTDRIKSEGVQQCIAGDQEGCTYAMDKLRDADDYDDAEFLKLHIILSLTLSNKQSVYRDNGGATIAEYEAYAKKLGGDADLLAIRGDSDYKIVEKGIECAKTLAEYGKSHNLTGRY